MKHLFIVNPTAGGHDATTAVSAKVKAAFAQRGGEFEIYKRYCYNTPRLTKT